MIRSLSLQTALRFMSARRHSKMVSFISASSTLGIAIGIIAILLVLSAMNGFETALKEKLLGVIPDAEILTIDRPMNNWRGFQQQLQELPEVEGAAPFIQLSAMVIRGDQLRALQLRGIDQQAQASVSDYDEYLIPALPTQLKAQELILGASLAEQLKVGVGDTVSLMIAPADGNFRSPRTYPFKIASLFKFGGQIDGITGFVNLEQAQVLAGFDDAVNGIELKVTDIFAANHIAYEAASQLPIFTYVTDWMRTHGHVYQDIQMVRGIVYIVMALVIAVACFNIVSTLVMTVQDKRGEIAILLTMGASTRTVMATFIWQGALSGLVGVVSGVTLGCLAVTYLNSMIRGVESLLGTSLLSADVYFIDHIPTVLRLDDVLLVAAIAWIMAIIATLYPAWRASRIQPARELGGH